MNPTNRWSTVIHPKPEGPHELRFHRTCAALVTLEVNDRTFNLAPKVLQGDIPGGGTWRRTGAFAFSFDLSSRGAKPVVVTIFYCGEPIRAGARRSDPAPTAAPTERSTLTTKTKPSKPSEDPNDFDFDAEIKAEFEARRARIAAQLANGTPLAAERMAIYVFDERTDFRMPDTIKLLNPQFGPQDALAARAMRRGRLAQVPRPDATLRRDVTKLAPVVKDAISRAITEGLGAKSFDPTRPTDAEQLFRVFGRFANGELGDAEGAPTEGVPDSAYFFCLPEFALLAADYGPEDLRPFFEACFPVFVRATRVYYRAYSNPMGMRWSDYGFRRFTHTWEEVEADQSDQFDKLTKATPQQWRTKYDELLAACCLGNAGGRPYSDAEIHTTCGHRPANDSAPAQAPPQASAE
jgi:hypothetical protein